jgi:RNA polymerase sigma-70 factor (ECF subfamily)
MDAMDDEDLALAADYRDNGNPAAIDRLVSKYGRSLLGYLRATTRNAHDAEEVFQDTWLKAMRKIAYFKGGSFKAWLTTIARNCVIDRARKSRPTASLDRELDEEGTRVVDLMEDEAAPKPEAGMGAAERSARIREAVGALPEALKEVFLLRVEQEMPFAEIASMLGIPLNTALGRMHYAVTRLRKELDGI